MYILNDDHLVLQKQLINFYLENLISPILNITYLLVVAWFLWVRLRPHWPFFEALTTFVCLLELHLFISCLGNHVAETLWMMSMRFLGDTFLCKLPDSVVHKSFLPIFFNVPWTLDVGIFCRCICWNWTSQLFILTGYDCLWYYVWNTLLFNFFAK